MLKIEALTVQDAYKRLLDALLTKGDRVGDTYEIQNCIVEIECPQIDSIGFPKRDISFDYANAELEWYWKGSNSCEEIGKHAKMWLRLSDDGKTNNSAYGYIIHKKYGYDQLQQVVELLKNDPDSRRAVINISDPKLNKIETHDLQCTIGLQFLVRNHALEMTVYMRSNDVYFGFPYDYIYFMSLMKYVATKLNLPIAKYTHVATSMHMYIKDIKKFTNNKIMHKLDYEKIIKENYDETFEARNYR